MQDWETDWSRDVLERIVVLLFALAGLADLAAGAPYLRRRHVLGILRGGEAEARAFVIGLTTGDPAPTDALERAGDAACLAMRFRVLALLLVILMARPFGLPGANHPRTGRLKPARPAGRQSPTPAPDTS